MDLRDFLILSHCLHVKLCWAWPNLRMIWNWLTLNCKWKMMEGCVLLGRGPGQDKGKFPEATHSKGRVHPSILLMQDNSLSFSTLNSHRSPAFLYFLFPPMPTSQSGKRRLCSFPKSQRPRPRPLSLPLFPLSPPITISLVPCFSLVACARSYPYAALQDERRRGY